MPRHPSLVIAIIVGGLTNACGGVAQPPSSSLVSPPEAAATATALPSSRSSVSPASQSPSAALDIVWTEQVLPGEILALIADRDRFVAVGNTDDSPVAWTSTDGASWDQHPVALPTDLPDENTGLPRDAALAARMGRLVRLDDTLYSFGHFSFMDHIRPVGWRWTDGDAWEPITSASPFYDAGSVSDVAAGNGVLVAARHDIALSELGVDSEVWAWNAAAGWVQSDLSVAEAERVTVNRLAWNDGVFLASGAVVPEQPDADAVWTARIWQSADGLTWREIAPPSEEVCALEADADGFVAMGVSPEETVVWRWQAESWNAVPLTGSPGRSGDSTGSFGCDIVKLSDRTVAILAGDDWTRAWWSADGASWVGGESLPDSNHVAGLGSTLVLARIEYGPTGPLATVVMTGSLP